MRGEIWLLDTLGGVTDARLRRFMLGDSVYWTRDEEDVFPLLKVFLVALPEGCPIEESE